MKQDKINEPKITVPIETDDFDFEELARATNEELTKFSTTGRKGVPSLTVVNTDSNGCRVKLSSELHKKLNSPTYLQVLVKGKSLLVGETLPNAVDKFQFSQGKGVTTIYSRRLVDFITKKFELDFSGRTSISFSEIKFHEKRHNDTTLTFAEINMA